MHCPDDSEVAALVAGNAAVDIRHAFEDHVDDCDACRALMVGLVKESFAWKPGARIERYVIRERIAAGAMGAVYRADDVELARPVALKRLHADDARAHARLLREARSAAQLQHPNVVAVYEVIEEPPCLAMELVEGVTLTDWLQTRRSWREITAMLAQAGRGLAAAHARGLIHGDFKPDNVLIDGDGRARVADFGLANVDLQLTQDRSGVSNAATKLARATATGAGTPAYMAPELVNGELPDARSDLYAFAITLFEALHGEHPFAGTTAEAMWSEMALGRVRTGRRRIPAWLDRRVRKGLAAEPGDRWPDVAAFVDALEARPTYPRWVAIGAAVLAAAGLALALAPGKHDDCADGVGLVDGLWTGDVRDSLTTGFLAVRPHAGVSIEAADRAIDGWAGAWKLGRATACTVADPARAARIACLDRHLDVLRAQIELWRSADAETVDNVVRAAAGLGSPADCTGEPAIGEVDPRISAMAAELGATVRSGHAASARQQIDALLAAASATTRPRDRATALLAAGKAEDDAEDLGHANTHYAAASQEAGRAGDDRLMLDATLLEAANEIRRGHGRDSLGMLDAAAAIDARSGQHRHDEIEFIRGEALIDLGDGTTALAVLLPLVPQYEARAAREPGIRRKLSGLYAKLAGAESSGDFRESAARVMRHVVELDEQMYGPDHPEVGRSLADLAALEMQLQRHPEAYVHLDRAVVILRAAYGDKNILVGFTYVTRAKLALYDGRFDEARADNEKALAILTGLLPDDHPMFAALESSLGETERNSDHYKEAIAHLERALRIYERSGSDPKSHATTLTSLGACYAQLNQLDVARRAYERSISEITDNHFDPMWLAEPNAGLANLDEAEGHKAAALDHDNKALALLAGHAGADVEALRAAILQQMSDLSK